LHKGSFAELSEVWAWQQSFLSRSFPGIIPAAVSFKNEIVIIRRKRNTNCLASGQE
jgi:hypothetical protein